jgi:hypothetical protein
MLMTHDTTPNQVKRLATNMYPAEDRMRELLVSATTENQRVQILLDVPGGIELPLLRSRIRTVRNGRQREWVGTLSPFARSRPLRPAKAPIPAPLPPPATAPKIVPNRASSARYVTVWTLAP